MSICVKNSSLNYQIDLFLETLPRSKPVFKVRSEHGNDLSLVLADGCEAYISEDYYTDPVEKLILRHASERFDVSNLKFNYSIGYGSVTTRIVDALMGVIISHSGLKNPKSSKLYKWLDRNRDRHAVWGNQSSLAEGLIELYRYGSKYNFSFNPDSIHAKNILSILEKMRQKY